MAFLHGQEEEEDRNGGSFSRNKREGSAKGKRNKMDSYNNKNVNLEGGCGQIPVSDCHKLFYHIYVFSFLFDYLRNLCVVIHV